VIHPLKSGEELVVRTLEPPLVGYTDRVEYWWRDVRDQLVNGELAETSVDRFFVAELNGAYVGSMTYCTPRDTRDLAVLGMVWTRPDQRRKGIGQIVLEEALADFRAGGGIAMYLCTTNPVAASLYAKGGFVPHIGDGMRYLAPGHGDFDRTFFADNGPATIRPGTWGDLARVSALYNQGEPDWLVKDYPRRVFRDMRYEGHYIRVWRPASLGRGTVLVLENRLKRVVGIASLVEVDSYYEQHTQILDFWACPAYLRQVPDLLAAIVSRAEAGSPEILQAYVAAVDREKREILAAGGFREEARLRNRLRLADQCCDLLVYSRSLGRETEPAHLPSDYYGARPAFWATK
jgi:GNAT superfamily N-acetyltransferase